LRAHKTEWRMAAPLHEDGMRRGVNEKASTRNVERTLPPVSSASGGLQPGIDLDNSAALQAADCPLDEVRQSAERPAIDEQHACLATRREIAPSVAPADAVRAERDRP
jgi:hypothetical protein